MSKRFIGASTRPLSLNRMAVAISLVLAAMAPPAAFAADPVSAAAVKQYDIPAGTLTHALNRFAQQSGVALSFDPALTAGKTSAGLHGSHSLQQGFGLLLQDSGLVAQPSDGGYSLTRIPAPVSGADTVLPTVTVAANNTSEGAPLAYLKTLSTSGALGEKRILDTPFSIAVASSEDIQERGARSIGQIFVKDAAVYTPTSSYTTDWWGTQIRGLPVRNNYVDDIPTLLYWGGDFPTEVVESVTALKGLAGFMYGFGEPGGALSYKLKRPTKSPETSVSLDYRNPGLISFHVDTSHNIDDDLALRANLATEQGTAYNAAEIKRTVGSLAADKHFGASLKWFSTLVFEDSKTTAEPLQFYFSLYDSIGSGGQLPNVTYDYDKINVDNAYYKTSSKLVSTGIEWRIDDQWKLTTQVGFSRKDHRSRKAFAYLLNAAGDYSGRMYDFADRIDTRFAQTMLQGNVQTGSVKHELVAGLGLQGFKELWSSGYQWANDFDGNLFVEQPFQAADKPGIRLDTVSADNSQTYAFVSDTIHFNKHWQTIAGLRFNDFKMKDLDDDPSTESGYKTSATSPTLALIYKPDDSTSLYGSYVEALEPGTRVAPPYVNAGEILGATVSKQYEVGAKHAAGDIDYAVALFRVERANQMDELRGADRYLTQDGLLIYDGLEVSGDYQLNRALNLGLSAVYLDATIDQVSADNIALQGNRPSYAPKWQAVVNAQYRMPDLPALKLHGNLRYFGASYTSDENTLSVPSRTLANAGFSYDFKLRGQALTLVGNVYNLFNKKYWAGGGWGSGNLGEARNLSLSLQAHY